MSCNSALYTINTNLDVAANGTIPVGSTVRRFGCNLQVNGPDIVCCGVGYYDVEGSITLTPEGAGEVGVQLYADGAPVPGALATVTGTAGNIDNLFVTTLVRQKCQGATSLE